MKLLQLLLNLNLGHFLKISDFVKLNQTEHLQRVTTGFSIFLHKIMAIHFSLFIDFFLALSCEILQKRCLKQSSLKTTC